MGNSYIRNITFDCAEPQRLAAFWAAALGYHVENGGNTFANDVAEASIVAPDGTNPRLYFNRVSETKAGKNRVHVDINTTDMDTAKERLVQLGARVVEQHERRWEKYTERWTVMADPEGNEFCLQHAPHKAVRSLRKHRHPHVAHGHSNGESRHALRKVAAMAVAGGLVAAVVAGMHDDEDDQD